MNKIMMQIAFALSALVAAAAHATDLNHASAFQLEAISGIGEKMAADIVAELNANGAFQSWDEFKKRVKGVGERNLKTMQKDGLEIK